MASRLLVKEKNDPYYVEKIAKDIDFVIKHTLGMTKEALEINEVLIDSILFRFIQISENMKRLSDDFRIKHAEISWVSVIGLRNKIVHDYGDVRLDVIYQTIQMDLPKLKEVFHF
jgi:uncharacterized protein with HEPN domain